VPCSEEFDKNVVKYVHLNEQVYGGPEHQIKRKTDIIASLHDMLYNKIYETYPYVNSGSDDIIEYLTIAGEEDESVTRI